jgi:hypothetical protein
MNLLNYLQDEQTPQVGVEFENLNDTSDRGRVVSYGFKAPSAFRNKARQVDINGLKSEDRKNVHFDGYEHSSKFTIGFEVEKNRLHRSSIREYPLFCGFESDSSCGYEAVTHVLPLIAKSKWRTKVFNMFVEAKHIIEDEYSPSDYKCGGHMHIGIKGMSGDEIINLLRPYSGIIYSIFRKRLANHYCAYNPQMRDGVYDKYSVCRINNNTLEYRLPSRISSVKQLMRRYELMYEILNFAVNDAGTSIAVLNRRLRPIVMSMYEQDTEKVDAIFELSGHFTKFLKTGKLNKYTCGWLEKWWSTSPAYGVRSSVYTRGFDSYDLSNREFFASHYANLI